jgi:hypothetical protein
MKVLETAFWDPANMLEIWFGKERKVTKYSMMTLAYLSIFLRLENVKEWTGD